MYAENNKGKYLLFDGKEKPMQRRICLIIAVASALALAMSPVALARTRTSGFTLSVTSSTLSNTVYFTPGQTPVVNVTATNNTKKAATCDLYLVEFKQDAPLGTIAPGTSAGGQMGIGPLYQNGTLTFNMRCKGKTVAVAKLEAIGS